MCLAHCMCPDFPVVGLFLRVSRFRILHEQIHAYFDFLIIFKNWINQFSKDTDDKMRRS